MHLNLHGDAHESCLRQLAAIYVMQTVKFALTEPDFNYTTLGRPNKQSQIRDHLSSIPWTGATEVSD
jgi:hypothetical protein